MSLRKSLLGASIFVSTAIFATMSGHHARAAATGATAPASISSELAQVDALSTSTPIKHVVIIYGENVSFDHYFGTYPHATNPSGEPKFTQLGGTPQANTLKNAALLKNNPNDTNTLNGVNAANPFRLDRSQAATADQNHAYTAEQQAYDGGKADLFPLYTGSGTTGGAGAFGTKGQVMGYFDGNTVTAMWNYAQHYAMSDNAYTDTYGPSTPGALEVIAGQTNGLVLSASTKTSYYVNDGQGGLTMINDVDPSNDTCSSTTNAGLINAKNIGDLLNTAGIPWGGFMGGFNLDTTNSNGTTGCSRSTLSTVIGASTADYIPHHNWFQYFTSTSNPTHARPATMANIGYTFANDGSADPANHEYDLNDFTAALAAGDFPAVSYIKMPAYQDAHAGYSDPLDEQTGVVTLINTIMQSPDWKSTAIIITYDDSDGWYDHAYATPTNPSFDSVADQLTGAGACGTGTPKRGVATNKPVEGRCGPGTRIPFIVISPWAKANFVASGQITQASVVRFIEDNWLGKQRLGGGSFDATSGSIMNMFDFKGAGDNAALILDPSQGTASGS